MTLPLEPCERQPCGDAGGLGWHYHRRLGLVQELSDCLVIRPKPFRLVIWEPLPTNAPGPHLAKPHCCYIRTIIFYHAPYVVSPWVKVFRANGRWHHNGSAGHFEEWDQIETRMGFDDIVSFEGERFDVSGGTVVWSHQAGQRRRWWMRYSARRVREAC